MADFPALHTRTILGLNIVSLARDKAAHLLEQHITEQIPVRLAFVNANLANVAYEDMLLHNVLGQFMLLNDGVGLNIASKILHGTPFPDNLNGTDFTPYFLEHCSTPLRVFLLGAEPLVITEAAEVFVKRWPRHILAGYQDGYFDKTEEQSVVDKIRAANPHLVLVAMGNGLQERWVECLVPAVALSAWGVGALFDFLAGKVQRAPLWMRKLNIEWVYRLLQEPKRMWKRYIVGNPKFILRIVKERLTRRRNRNVY